MTGQKTFIVRFVSAGIEIFFKKKLIKIHFFFIPRAIYNKQTL